TELGDSYLGDHCPYEQTTNASQQQRNDAFHENRGITPNIVPYSGTIWVNSDVFQRVDKTRASRWDVANEYG
ncbi:MAG: hypothetical protein ACK5R2_09170, partial [Cyanobacteriota bacterium]